MPTHKCHICNKTLSRSTKLTEHMRSHTGEKPFQCTVCGMRSARSGDLTAHMAVHSGSHRFRCEGQDNGVPWGCGKGFHKKAGVNRHLQCRKAGKCRPGLSESASSAGELADNPIERFDTILPQPPRRDNVAITKIPYLQPNHDMTSESAGPADYQDAKLTCGQGPPFSDFESYRAHMRGTIAMFQVEGDVERTGQMYRQKMTPDPTPGPCKIANDHGVAQGCTGTSNESTAHGLWSKSKTANYSLDCDSRVDVVESRRSSIAARPSFNLGIPTSPGPFFWTTGSGASSQALTEAAVISDQLLSPVEQAVDQTGLMVDVQASSSESSPEPTSVGRR